MPNSNQRHVLSALVQNVPGVLAHISGMLASRGFNIDSLAVGETEDPHLSRMTFVVVGDNRVLEQVGKQLEKIVTVVLDDAEGDGHAAGRQYLSGEGLDVDIANPESIKIGTSVEMEKIVRGEGEETARRLMAALETGGRLDDIPGLLEIQQTSQIIAYDTIGRIIIDVGI